MRMLLAAAVLLSAIPTTVSSAGTQFVVPSVGAILNSKPAPDQFPAVEETAAYDPGALAQCQRHRLAAYYNQCLMIIKNRAFQAPALSTCGRHLEPGGLNLCLNEIADARFQDAPLSECGRHQTPIGLNNCLHFIREKAYTAEEIKVCSVHATPAGLNDCLALAGEPMPKEPPKQPEAR